MTGYEQDRQFTWRVTFDAKYFGTSMVIHRPLTQFIGAAVQGLTTYAATV